MLELKDNVVISTGVVFVTHDWSASRVLSQKLSLWGKIIIGNNCFIGERATVMYGVELADNIIVAAGSVVANSFYESNIIIGGNPAKKIGTWEDFYLKYENHGISGTDIREAAKNNDARLIKRKEKHSDGGKES